MEMSTTAPGTHGTERPDSMVSETPAAGPVDPVIVARNLRRAYSSGDTSVAAVAGINLRIGRGEFVAVMGPSGSGKSTLLHLLGGLDVPDEGQVLLEGDDLAHMTERERSLVRRRRIGLVLQFPSLLLSLSAVENVAFPLLLDRVASAEEQALAALTSVGLGDRAHHRPGQLSGGEQQRVVLARALVTRPAVVLADEPTGALDSAAGIAVLHLLRQAAERGQTIVMITHDREAAVWADRIVQIRDGELVGSPTTAPTEMPVQGDS